MTGARARAWAHATDVDVQTQTAPVDGAKPGAGPSSSGTGPHVSAQPDTAKRARTADDVDDARRRYLERKAQQQRKR